MKNYISHIRTKHFAFGLTFIDIFQIGHGPSLLRSFIPSNIKLFVLPLEKLKRIRKLQYFFVFVLWCSQELFGTAQIKNLLVRH